MDTIASHIEVTPGVAGGKPRIAGHRITVQNIVIWHERLGVSADAIATEYGVSLADVYAPQRTSPGMIVRGLMLMYEVLRPEEMIGRVEFL